MAGVSSRARAMASAAEASVAGEAAPLSAYELQRLDNIARNQKVLEALGLVRSDATLHQQLRGKGDKGNSNKRRKEDPDSAESRRAAVRRSQRLAGMPAGEEDDDDDENLPLSLRRGAAQPTSGAHESARSEYDLWASRWSSKQAGVTVVGTASYAHTLMRVMTMGEGGLANRIKAIERACGQHAVAKMKLFATILALEGYVELAEEASSAYERLKEKLGEPCAPAEEEE